MNKLIKLSLNQNKFHVDILIMSMLLVRVALVKYGVFSLKRPINFML